MDPSYISPQRRWATGKSFDCSDFGEGEGVRVNPNIVRIVMHIEIYGRSLTSSGVHVGAYWSHDSNMFMLIFFNIVCSYTNSAM